MDSDKAVDVYLAEYNALRKEIEFNLEAEKSAINFSLVVLGGLVSSVLFISGKTEAEGEHVLRLQRLLIAAAPLFFSGIYMMLCRRHANSRRISRYITKHLGAAVRRWEPPDAFQWDLMKFGDKPPRHEQVSQWIIAALVAVSFTSGLLGSATWLVLIGFLVIITIFSFLLYAWRRADADGRRALARIIHEC